MTQWKNEISMNVICESFSVYRRQSRSANYIVVHKHFPPGWFLVEFALKILNAAPSDNRTLLLDIVQCAEIDDAAVLQIHSLCRHLKIRGIQIKFLIDPGKISEEIRQELRRESLIKPEDLIDVNTQSQSVAFHQN